MKIREVQDYSKRTLENINRLIPQLSDSAPSLTIHRLNRIIESDSSFLFVAEEDGKLIGLLTLVIVDIPTCIKALIEDVIVDADSQGKGTGEKLTIHAIEIAKEKGASLVNLTCSPWREAANALYTKLGFEKRDTNVYKLEI